MNVNLLALVSGLFMAVQPLAADPGPAALPATLPAVTPNAPPDCWVEHAQVQPSAAREDKGDEPSGSARFRQMTDQHLGAEHPTPTQMRPCKLPAARATPKAGAAEAGRR